MIPANERVCYTEDFPRSHKLGVVIRTSATIVSLTVLLVLAACKSPESSSGSFSVHQLEAARKAEVPLPASTPFDEAPNSRAAYLEAYRDGYRSGLVEYKVVFHPPDAGDAIRQAGWDAGNAAGYMALTYGPPVPPPTKCPFGHGELKRVPIIYGMLFRNADLERKIENLEVWPGGCIRGDEKEQLVCPTCRYAFEPHLWNGGQWEPDPKLLRFKPDPFIAAWPVGENLTQNGLFSQRVRGGDVSGEEFFAWYKLSEADTDALVRKHLAQFAFKFARTERNFEGGHCLEYRAFRNPHYYLVGIIINSDPKGIFVHAERSAKKPRDY